MYKYFFNQKKKNLFSAPSTLKNRLLQLKKIYREEIFINNSKKMCTFANSISKKLDRIRVVFEVENFDEKRTKNIAER